MRAHILDSSQSETGLDSAADTATAVGTFAAGQSSQGSFHVAAEARLGSFASGLAEHDATAASESDATTA